MICLQSARDYMIHKVKEVSESNKLIKSLLELWSDKKQTEIIMYKHIEKNPKEKKYIS